MSDPFVHLHVASGYSMRHGASTPAALVERAAEHGMDTLALTDRDGAYGAVKFVTACMQHGVRPVLGANLAVGVVPERSKTPARGGASVDPRLPRVTVLARDGGGWASLCRLISATHLAGERGRPVASLDLIAEHARGLVVLLGPDSDVGTALAAPRADPAPAPPARCPPSPAGARPWSGRGSSRTTSSSRPSTIAARAMPGGRHGCGRS